MELKGYAGGLVVSTANGLHIGLLGVYSDDVGESFTVLRLRYFGNLAQDRKTLFLWTRQMCEGSTSRIVLRDFQLESLILAQNERWRQA